MLFLLKISSKRGIRYEKRRNFQPDCAEEGAMASSPAAANSISIFPPYSNLPAKRSQFHSSPFLCRCHSRSSGGGVDFVLHDSLDASGIETKHARAAREGFVSQIQRLSSIERETSISINRRVDLGKVALHIAAEDDALVSHSSVALPVDSFIERLDDLAMGFCSLYIPPSGSSPELFLGNLERYFYVHKGFHRSIASTNQLDVQALYLHSVLTRRSGSATMLSLIYSEMLKMLQLCGFLNFDAEIYFPHDAVNLPRGYHKHKSKVSDEPHIVTVQSLLVEILSNLKVVFWPFKYDHTGSLFARAAQAANCVGLGIAEGGLSKPSNNTSGFEFASAKAAQHRLGRGVWTSVNFGDMRRALAACERLILLGTDPKELRDYGALLYHCGFYKEALQYMKMYQDSRQHAEQYNVSLTPSKKLEDDAVEKLMVRLNLISMEDGWTKASAGRKCWGNCSEPW